MTKLTTRVMRDNHHITVAYLNIRNHKAFDVELTGKVRVQFGKYYIYTNVIVDDSLPDDVIGLNQWASEWLGAKDGDRPDIDIADISQFNVCLDKVRKGKELSADDVRIMMDCVRHNNLNPQHLFEFLNIINERDLTLKEISLLVDDLSKNCNKIAFDQDTYCFHSLGGIPGNKITPIVVSIVAAAGIMIPKMATHAITGACGTMDSVEIYCDVMSKSENLKKICERTNGILACSDSLYIESYNTDLILMTAEKILEINPRSLMLASIIAVEKAAGTKNLLLDIPVGENTKVKDEKSARNYEKQFIEIGKLNSVNVRCMITDGRQPIGFAVGPVLEAIETIRILEGKENESSALKKSLECAIAILEMAGKKDADRLARDILESGKALEKFREIVAAQGGDANISSDDLAPGKFHVDTVSNTNGEVIAIDNVVITAIAKIAGAPADKGAGLVLHKKIGDGVKIGEPLITIYSNDEIRMEDALREFVRDNPFDIR